MIAIRVVKGASTHFVLRLPEWLLALILSHYGIVLLTDPSEFATNPVYVTMARMATEGHWGAFLFTIGSVRLIALLINGTFRASARVTPYLRASGAFLSCLAWLLIASGLYLSGNSPQGWFTYTMLLVGDLVVAVVVAREAGRAERRYTYARAS